MHRAQLKSMPNHFCLFCRNSQRRLLLWATVKQRYSLYFTYYIRKSFSISSITSELCHIPSCLQSRSLHGCRDVNKFCIDNSMRVLIGYLDKGDRVLYATIGQIFMK